MVESLDQCGNYILLANTHLFYESRANFIRLIQSMVSIKYIENIINNLVAQNKHKSVAVIFAGDFNSNPQSLAIDFILKGQIPYQNLNESMLARIMNFYF